MVDVVVLNYNDANETIKYVNQIYHYPTVSHIIVVDNCSTDDSFNRLSTIVDDRVRVVRSEKNGGYGYGNNFGVKYAISHFNSEYIAITNPDVIYTNECIHSCEEFLKDNVSRHYAVCAPRMKDLDNKYVVSAWMIPSWFEYVCFSLSFLGKFFKLQYVHSNDREYTDCECIAGSMLVIAVEAFTKIGMYDESIFLFCEETVLGIKLANAGYKTALLNNEEFIHAHSVSINKSISSYVKQQKIMWQSRLYALKEHYHVSKIQYILAYILSKIGVLETKARLLRDGRK